MFNKQKIRTLEEHISELQEKLAYKMLEEQTSLSRQFVIMYDIFGDQYIAKHKDTGRLYKLTPTRSLHDNDNLLDTS